MAFNDDGFLDDYEIKELIEKFENQLRSAQSFFFDADELNIIIEHYVQKNDIKTINIIAELATTYHATNPITNLIVAKKYLAVQDADKALMYLDDDNNNRQDPDYYLSLGYCHSLRNEHKKSIYAYKNAIRLLEKENCEDIYTSMAFEYLWMGEYEQALNYFKKGVVTSPEQYGDITNCYFLLNRNSEAIDYFKAEIDRVPLSIDAWMAFGNCYLRMRMLEEAAEKYEYALAINQHYEPAYVNIVTIYNELERYSESIETVDEALRNKVNSPILYCLYGEALLEVGRKQDAINNYKKAIELDENIVEAYAGLAYIFSDDNDHKTAIKFLKHTIELAPYNVIYLSALAEEYKMAGNYKSSLKYLKEIEKISNDNASLYIDFMVIYLLMDDVDNAIKYIDKGLERVGKVGKLLYRKAYLYLAVNEYEVGMLALEEALNVDFDGLQEFIDFDPDYILNDESIVDLINEYKFKNRL